MQITILNPEEIIARIVKKNGTGAHISLPKELIGEKVKIIVMKK